MRTPVTFTTVPADFRGSDKARGILEKLLEFIDSAILPLEQAKGLRWGDAVDHDLLQTVWKMSAEQGFYTLLLPEDLGGAGLSTYDICAVKEAVIGSGAILAPHVLGELSGPPRIGHLFKYASEHQIEQFLRPVCSAGKAVCFALTEAEAGSDAAAIQTSAVRDGNGFVLNGTKRFISGAPYADFAIVLAVTDPEAGPRGISAFFVDLNAEGCERDSSYEVLSGPGSHADIIMKDVRVAPENLIGQEGAGFALGMSRITINRLLHCASMLGMANLAVKLSVGRAAGRKQFGRAIGQFQAIQHMLADMQTELYAAQCMMYDAAARQDTGKDIRMEASMSKVFSGETAFKIADRAMQIHGGAGLLKGDPIEFIFRYTRIFRIVTGTSEIQRNTIAKGMLAAAAR